MLDHDDHQKVSHSKDNQGKATSKPVYEFKDQNCYKLAKSDIFNLSESPSSILEPPDTQPKIGIDDPNEKQNHTIMIIRAPTGSTIVNLNTSNA